VRLSIQLKQHIAIWLCAILVVLAFAVSNHSVQHHEDGVNTHHCTLCFHQHQLNKTLNSFAFSIPVQKQHYQTSVDIFSEFESVSLFYYNSRAPPFAS